MLRAQVLLLLFLAPTAWPRGQTAKPGATASDHSQEAFVIEQFSRRLKFENDGTSLREDTGKIRIQSEAGVRQYGLLTFSYASGTGTFEIRYVRVRKPDGSVVETPPEGAQDMAAEITRQAPFYSDLHEKHLAVKGLSVGDELEYQIQEHTTKPLAPGQFWTSYGFTHTQIVLNELLEVSVPRERPIKLKSGKPQPEVREADGYRTYTWHTSNAVREDDSDDKPKNTERAWQQARGRLPQPDVLLSSFKSWEEVGRWYGDLESERVKVTPDVKARAGELTKNSADEAAKIRALYSYVSTQVHYIGIAFGIGRYQPHSASEVLANQYGDCKDKHTLLASLLTSAGISAYPALISSSHEVDPDVPSPGQFDHVITVVPKGNELIWLDTTSEVGPYQFLVAPLRGKHALVVSSAAASLVSTPAALPFASTQVFRMDAKLDEAGTLHGDTEYSVRGDSEYLLRALFRTIPLPQWKDLGQRISLSSGFGGDVSDVTASSPENTDGPFHFAYKYTRKEFGDWANKRILSPSPMMVLLAPGDEDLLPSGPSWLGPPIDLQFSSQVELPSAYRPELPTAIHLKKDFAEYDSTYEFKDGKLINSRRLKTLHEEVPASQREEYMHFMKVVKDDYGAYIQLSSAGAVHGSVGKQDTTPNGINAVRNLPDTTDAEAARLEQQARDAVNRHDLQSAVSSLYRAVAVDPKFARAWLFLGSVLLAQKQKDAGMEAFHKAIAIDPAQPVIAKTAGFALMAAAQFEDAVTVWQDFVKVHPEDAEGPMALGNCFFGLGKYAEAAQSYEQALKLGGPEAPLQANLGSAYLRSGQPQKAEQVFVKLAETDKDGSTYNNVAYQMANASLRLPLALNYAKQAVHRAEEESEQISLQNLQTEDLNKVFKLAAYWDTLGWVDAKMSNFDEAEQYLRAAWKLTQDGVYAGHLCDVYRRSHKASLAVEMCRLAVYRMPLSSQVPLSEYKDELDAAQKNLDQLTGGAKASGTGTPADVVIRDRTFKLPRFLTGTESAEFFVLMTSDGKGKTFKVEDVKFISGSKKMKLEGKQLKNIDFNVPAPPDTRTHFVRRGILGCYQYSGCSFVLLEQGTVRSLN